MSERDMTNDDRADVDGTASSTTDEQTFGKDAMMSDTSDTEAQDDQTAHVGHDGLTENGGTDAVADPSAEVQFSIVFDDDDDDVVEASPVTENERADNHADAAPGEESEAPRTGEDAETAAASGTTSDAAATVSSDAASSHDEAEPKGLAREDHMAADNAARVAQTLSLAGDAAQRDSVSPAVPSAGDKTPASLRLSERLDKELGSAAADKVLLKSYPSLALVKVTVTDRNGHHTLDHISADFYAGHLYAIRVESDDERVALMSVMTGMMRPHDGAVMNKSLNVLEIEPGELRGHRLGIIPQRYAVRDDLDAERNVLYAMDASGRTFLKPKPVIARELLHQVGFDSETPNAAVGNLTGVQQRLVAIARAISCDAEVIIADEPTGGLDPDDSVAVLKTLIGLTHGDPKRCVIVITGSDEVAEVAERVVHTGR